MTKIAGRMGATILAFGPYICADISGDADHGARPGCPARPGTGPRAAPTTRMSQVQSPPAHGHGPEIRRRRRHQGLSGASEWGGARQVRRLFRRRLLRWGWRIFFMPWRWRACFCGWGFRPGCAIGHRNANPLAPSGQILIYAALYVSIVTVATFPLTLSMKASSANTPMACRTRRSGPGRGIFPTGFAVTLTLAADRAADPLRGDQGGGVKNGGFGAGRASPSPSRS